MTAPDPLPWARAAKPAEKPQTDRRHQLVEGLPSWEPLPQGVVLSRPSRR